MTPPKPLITTFGCGADTPQAMAEAAKAYQDARAIKLKLTGERVDSDRVAYVRDARPDVWLAVDANQSFTAAHFDRMLPQLIAARVQLIEQPFPVGQESLLDDLKSPIAICADEAVLTSEDLAPVVGRVNTVNIKLDKCGGLTAALEMARQARERGLETMVGNMIGTSLAMAPAFIVGQLCSVVDLDGPLFLAKDRSRRVGYKGGLLRCPSDVWGFCEGSGANRVKEADGDAGI